MKINYFSFAHVLYLLIAAGLVAGLYFLFRSKGLRAQRVAVLSLVLINVIQHLFKLEIYPITTEASIRFVQPTICAPF